jgi:hypothetical protein
VFIVLPHHLKVGTGSLSGTLIFEYGMIGKVQIPHTLSVAPSEYSLEMTYKKCLLFDSEMVCVNYNENKFTRMSFTPLTVLNYNSEKENL